MLINYTKSNVHAFGTADGKEIHSLRPGWNEFPSRIWKEYETHPDVKQMLADGVLVLLEEKVKVGKKTVVIGKGDEELHITKLDEKKAIEVVKATFNRDMLQRWADEETRHKVKRVVMEQLKPLLPESLAAQD